jgi:hypothetical protein
MTASSSQTSKLISFGCFALTLVILSRVEAYEINWDSGKNRRNTVPTKSLQSIKFSNGIVLTQVRLGEDGERLVINNPKGNEESVLFEDDRVYIEAAWPNKGAASIAIVSHRCSGNGIQCSWVATDIVLVDGNRIRTYEITDRTFKLIARLDSAKVTSAVAKNVVVGKDAYGSDVIGTLEYLPNKGFIDSRMKRKYRQLVGSYPEDFFERKLAREPLAKLIGSEKFKKLRLSMGVSSGSTLHNYRYLHFVGCTPHRCGAFPAGAVVIDTVDDDIWWLQTNENGGYESGGSRKLLESETSGLKNAFKSTWLSKDAISLGIDKNGNPTLVERTKCEVESETPRYERPRCEK